MQATDKNHCTIKYMLWKNKILGKKTKLVNKLDTVKKIALDIFFIVCKHTRKTENS